MAIENLLESIKSVFQHKDTKEKELLEQKENLSLAIDDLVNKKNGISYKALIEEDKQTMKEYENLNNEIEKKLEELNLIEEKIKALDKFKVSKDIKENAADIYKAIQKEIDNKSKELGKKADSYIKAREEMKKTAIEITDLYKEINLLPLELGEIIDLIEPESIGKTDEELQEYKEILKRRDYDRYLYLFEDNRLKHTKDFNRRDINQILNADIRINPYH